MLSRILDKATALVDSRFLLVALFPVLVFLAAIVLLLVGLDSGWLTDFESSWMGWSDWQQWLSVVAGVAALFVAGYLVFVSVTPLTRLLEGYFGPVAWLGELLRLGRDPRVKASSRERNQQGQGSAETPEPDDRLARHKHPGDAFRFASRLGNSLRAAEVHPLRAYGIDAVLVWPHLVARLPDAARKAIDGARTSLDFLVVVSTAAVGYGIASGTAIALLDGGRTLWISCVAISLGVAYLAYCGAVAAARDYGAQIRTAFDQHRFAVLDALNLPRPSTPLEERRLWEEVNDLIALSEPRNWWLYRQPEDSA